MTNVVTADLNRLGCHVSIKTKENNDNSPQGKQTNDKQTKPAHNLNRSNINKNRTMQTYLLWSYHSGYITFMTPYTMVTKTPL